MVLPRSIVFVSIWVLLAASGGAQRLPVEGRRGMVVAADALASQVGVDILRQGGNAVDAAVGVGFALAVTFPIAGNLGGGGFMVIRMADGSSTAIDFREVAPAAAGRDLYLDEDGQVIPMASLYGYRAAGVPGTVAGLLLALEKYGRLDRSVVLEPARRLAAEGFVMSGAMAAKLRTHAEALGQFPETRRIFLRDGLYWNAGDRFVQSDLAATIERIQQSGREGFYAGETARLIAESMTANGGLITREDLAAYRPVERAPLRGRYRGLEILTMPPPSSGGICLLQMLQMVEPHDLGALGFGGSETIHLMTEAMRRAFRDRAQFPGDPAFVDVPVDGLVSRDYAVDRMADFEPERATKSEAVSPGRPVGYESPETTHFSIVDEEGGAVSTTYTLNRQYGCNVTVPGTGVLLNNEMDDFTSKPGITNSFGLIQGEANAIAGGKRPLSSMTPSIVLRDNELFMVLGSPGGPKIINIVFQVLVNVVDHGMNIQQAVDLPRFHHQWMPDEIRFEPFALAPDVARALEARGHRLSPFVDDPPRDKRYWGDAAAILVDPATGTRQGAADPRNPRSMAVGY
ncbi:MAG: gamma-glutamyltransferase [Opitutaceae bacterium]